MNIFKKYTKIHNVLFDFKTKIFSPCYQKKLSFTCMHKNPQKATKSDSKRNVIKKSENCTRRRWNVSGGENPIIFEVNIGKSVINVFGHRLTSLSSQSDDDCECERAKEKK